MAKARPLSRVRNGCHLSGSESTVGVRSPFHVMKTLCALILFSCLPAAAAEVTVERVPEDGLQPQVAVQIDGTVHLVYLTGQPEGADIRYTFRSAAAAAWAAPVTVNRIPQSAMATGTIRGAQIALGKGGRVHVVWNGVGKKGENAGAPLYYSRGLAGKFEAQRTMNEGTIHLDGGASVAATDKGAVFVVWHAALPDGKSEADRRIFINQSTDEGVTFSAPAPAKGVPAGVCPCCSLKAFAASDGSLLTLYRNASAQAQRDITLLTSKDGMAFTSRVIDPWPIAACPMSSAALIAAKSGTRAAWETNATIYTAMLDQKTGPVAVSKGQARHPAMAFNARGETLVVWSVGTGWQRGGELAWVILDANGKPTEKRGSSPGVLVWGHTAAYANAVGDFIILR